MDKMHELTPEEAGLVCGGTGAKAECTVHSWEYMGPSTAFDRICHEYQCSICGKTEYRSDSGEHFCPQPMPAPEPDDGPVPVPMG